MTEYMVGGRRRIDRVLAPDYLEGIDQFDMDELRARKTEAERAVSDVGGSDLAHLGEPELRGAIDHLADVEARLSRSRRQVQNVVDRLTGEIARRYQAGHVPIALP